MRTTLPVILAAGLLAAGCSDAEMPVTPLRDAPAAEARGGGPGGEQVQERYVVVLASHVPDVAAEARSLMAAAGEGGRIGHLYEHALKGFSVSLPPGAVAALAGRPSVAYVEPDRERHVFAQTIPTGVRRILADGNGNIGIDGVDDQRVDVDVAIIDTGVDFEHPDLNVAGGVNCTVSSGGGPPWARSYVCETGGDDDHYHGTHVAGTVAALDNGIGVVGVAPGARVWAVKVLDGNGSGYTSMIVAGIDWVAANAGTIEVANMSLGGSGFSQAEYDAIQGAVDNGVAFAVAAGNSDADANNYSPAAFDNVLTVSALADFDGQPGGNGSATCRSDQDDTLADFSNWGDAVQIAAPGVCILSTYPIEQGEYGTISGTSMASPHVAGALALLASSANPSNATDVGNLYNQVIGAGNAHWTDDSGDGIKEPLLDVGNTTLFAPTLVAGGGDGGGGGDTNSSPTASFTSSCTDLACDFDGTGSSDDGSISSHEWDFGDGATGSGATASHVYASGGTYTVTLTVTDDEGASASESGQVSVSAGDESGGATTMSVADLDGSRNVKGNSGKWEALVEVEVRDEAGNPVEGATVSGDFSPGSSTSGTTDSTGRVTLASGNITADSTTFTVSGVHHPSLSYDAGSNTDPDLDSDGTSMTITRVEQQ